MVDPLSPTSPTNPLAMITGASSGIGRELARRLAERGYRLLLIARRGQRLEQLAEQLTPLTPCILAPLDLADATALAPAVNALVHEHGPVRVLINNAGFGCFEPFVTQDPALFQRIIQVNFLAPALLTRAVLPGMLAQHRGQIINIATVASKMGPGGHAAYAAAKSALVGFSQSLAVECAGTGVHISYVNPGLVRTEFFDHPTYAGLTKYIRKHGLSAEDVARRIVCLLDHPRLELCIPRHYRLLDWIKALSPTLAHRIVARYSRCPATVEPTTVPDAACPEDADKSAASRSAW